MSIYNFNVTNAEGKRVDLSEYKGKVLLIINSATECGFTPQYALLQELYEKYKEEGMEILDFPCNQFGNQAPGSNEEIASFCSARFGVTFPHFAKIDVKGEHAEPLFQYLIKEKGFQGFDPAHKITALLEEMLEKENPDYKNEPDIKWNFTKFLIDREGNVISRFEPTEDMSIVEGRIKELL
ncbi:glutathione peroxidase [Aminipila sp.]|uniref:glutathione peroxidase n=1 Tax=Aminipila sp. TaxID=2060095 RepID=UPI00289BA2CC|nr:glutathione peroxidase [Aminipila sp.]